MQSRMVDPVRQLPLEGCFNVRDVGGYRTRDGKTVRWQRLYRAGAPHAPTEADLEVLRGLGIATVLDLRTAGEIEERGRYADILDLRASHHLPMLESLPVEEDLLRWTDPEFVADHYAEMLAGASAMVVEALSILTDPSAYPVLVHCSAGKDRTGVLVAIILGLLDVSDDTIVDDYALSGAGMRDMLAYFTRLSTDPDRLERHAPAMLAADPVAMRGFIVRLRERHGSFAEYVTALEVASAVPHLRAALLD